MFSCFRSSAHSKEYAPLLNAQKEHEKSAPTHPSEKSTRAKLDALRKVMEENEVDVYVVPTADAHGSEYVGDCDKRREWISGFTGSAGVAVVTSKKALLFTDSRYYVQASQQLDQNWTLQKVGLVGVPSWDEYLASLEKGSRVGMDATLTSATTAQSLLSKLSPLDISIVYPDNLVDKIWTSRPARSSAPITVHPLRFSGQVSSEKIKNLRSFISSHPSNADSYLLTSLPNIAWLLNLRGSDIMFSPLFYAYMLVDADEVVLWVQDGALSKEARVAVEEVGGRIAGEEKILVNATASFALLQAVGEENFFPVIRSPIDVAQAIKNPIEIAGFEAAYLRDGAAWVRWAAWLEAKIKNGAKISEWDAAEELTKFREGGENFAGLSYENISATGENAALPHYAPSSHSSSIINTSTPYLNDSGAQYLDGTIDTTRTVHFGRPTAEQKRAFTRVLQGHIAIDSLVFPEGTSGLQIDILARRPMWGDGMNYMHGTGHGVGEYLSVHEGPEGFGSSMSFHSNPLVPGHVLSNEPGYYEIGSFGIRLESVIGVKEVQTRRGFGDKRWLGFQRFTTVPIQTTMVDWKLLSADERSWLRKHNDECRRKLLPLMRDDKRACLAKFSERQSNRRGDNQTPYATSRGGIFTSIIPPP
ncbi:Xaa-Pro aminopeptidase, partial [Phenoliferia sp. Uapishka_3]